MAHCRCFSKWHLSSLAGIHEGIYVGSLYSMTQDTVPQHTLPSLVGVRRSKMLPHFLAALEGLQASQSLQNAPDTVKLKDKGKS